MDSTESKPRTTYNAPRLLPFGQLSAVTLNGMGTKVEGTTYRLYPPFFKTCPGGDGSVSYDTKKYPCF